jgi:hypothetical protein
MMPRAARKSPGAMPGLWFDEVGDQRPAGAEIPPLYLEYQPGCADHARASSALRNCWLAVAGAWNALRARCSEAAAIWIVVAAISVAPRTVRIVLRIVRLPKCWRSAAKASARRVMRRLLEIRFGDDDCYVQAITKRRARLLVKSFFG